LKEKRKKEEKRKGKISASFTGNPAIGSFREGSKIVPRKHKEREKSAPL